MIYNYYKIKYFEFNFHNLSVNAEKNRFIINKYKGS